MSERKTAIVTGAGSGIGAAIAAGFGDLGIQVVLAGRRTEPLEDMAQQIRTAGGEARVVQADVADRKSVQAMSQECLQAYGRIDVLVNNAGINTRKRNLRDISDEDWDRVIEINLTGAFNAFRSVMTQMEQQAAGLVLNIASMAGKRAGTVGGVAYSASKFGLAALTQSINAEFRETGIRACCIYPGEVDTPILDLRPNPVSEAKRAAALRAEDVATVACTVAQLPDHAVVEEITIFPRRAVAT